MIEVTNEYPKCKCGRLMDPLKQKLPDDPQHLSDKRNDWVCKECQKIWREIWREE